MKTKILTNFDKIRDKYEKPHRLHMDVTSYCNLKCEHCYQNADNTGRPYSFERLSKIIQQARAKNIRKITLTGGEFFTHPEWKRLASASLEAVNNVYILTNGMLVDDLKLKWLAQAKVRQTLKNWLTFKRLRPVDLGLGFSLDGLKAHSLLRKNNAGKDISAEAVLRQIEMATNYGLHVTVNTTVTSVTAAEELPQLFDRLTKMKIDRWQIAHPFISGRLEKSSLKDVSFNWLEQAKKSYKYIIQQYLKNYPSMPAWRLEISQVFRHDLLQHGFTVVEDLNYHPCQYNCGTIVSCNEKDVLFCPSLPGLVIGDFSPDADVSNLYSDNAAFDPFIKKGLKDLPCADCRYLKVRHGGCRAYSLSYGNDLWAKDPLCCALAPFFEENVVPLLPQKLQDQYYAAVAQVRHTSGV